MLNDRLQPEDSPIARRRKPISSLEYDVSLDRSTITEAHIQDRTVTSDKLASDLSLGTINDAVLGTPTINGQISDGGTATNLVLVTPTIGTPALTGGTLTNPTISGGTATTLVLNSSTVGTPSITGGTASSLTSNNAVIGTPALTGGTLNPTVYQASGTAGATGTIVYAKDLVPNLGTVIFQNGIAISIS